MGWKGEDERVWEKSEEQGILGVVWGGGVEGKEEDQGIILLVYLYMTLC